MVDVLRLGLELPCFYVCIYQRRPSTLETTCRNMDMRDIFTQWPPGKIDLGFKMFCLTYRRNWCMTSPTPNCMRNALTTLPFYWVPQYSDDLGPRVDLVDVMNIKYPWFFQKAPVLRQLPPVVIVPQERRAGFPWKNYDVMTWKPFPHFCPFVRGIPRSPMNSQLTLVR